MMTETEVKKDVSKALEIDEKCGLDMNSYQDQLKAKCNGTNHCNEANDLDNSYIFVTGTDGLPDDAIDKKNVAAEDLSVSPESKAAPIEDQGAESVSQSDKLNAVGGEVNECLNAGENGSIERSNEDPCIVNDSTWKEESSLEDGERVQGSVADSPEGHTGEIGSLAEVEQLENPGGRVKSLKEAEAENVGDQNGTVGGAAKGEQEISDDITKPESPPGSLENQESEAEALELAPESVEKGELDNISLHLSSSVNANNKSEDQISVNAIEALESCQGYQNMVVDVVELNLQDASVGAKDEVKLTNEAVETVEHEFSASASLDPDLENAIKEETLKKEAKTALPVDVLENQQCDTPPGNNDQGVLEQIDEAKAVTSSDCHAEKQESEVGVVGLVAESGEKGSLDNILSPLNDSGNANDRCEDRINLNAIEALETCSGSQDAVVDVVELKLQDVSIGAEIDNDVTLTREAVETAEHEFPLSTSLDSDLESYPTKEEAFKEEANTTVSLDVPENKQCDTTVGNNVQGVPEHINDAKSVVSSIDCHVETVRDLVLEEKNEDFFVSHVDNRGQSPEEPEEPDINSDNSRLASETMQSETETKASVPTQSIAASNAGAPQADIGSSDAEAIGVFSSSVVDGAKSESTAKVLPSQPEIESSDAEAIGPVSSSLVDGPKSEITEKGLPSHPEVECSDAEPTGAVSSIVDGPKPEITEKGLPSHPEVECSDPEPTDAVSSLVAGPKSEINEKGLPSHPEIECSDGEAIEAVSSSLVDGPKSEITEKGLPSHPEIECSDAEAIEAVSSSLVDGPKSEITEKGLPSHPEIECSDGEAIEAVSSSLVDGPKSAITEKGLPSHPEVECSDTEPTDAVSSLVAGPKSEINEKGLPSHPEIECSDGEAIEAVSSSLVDGPKSEITEKGLPSHPEIECSDAEAIEAVSSSLVDGPKSEITEKGLPSHPEVECSDAEPTDAVSSLVAGPKSEINEKGLPSHPEIECSDGEAIEAVSSSLVDGPKSEIIEKGLPRDDSWIRCAANEASSGSEITLDAVVLAEKKPTLQSGEAHAETEVSIGEAIAADIPPTTFDAKFEPEVSVHNVSAISSGERTDDVTVACRTEVLDGYNINEDDEANIVEIDGLEDKGDQLDGSAGSSTENFFLQENEDSGDSHSNNNSVASPEGSSANMTNGEEASVKTKPKPFNFLIRVPRFDDESLREQIRLAKLHVDEKTKLRDAIQAQIQQIRANSQIHGIDYEYAKVEGRGARKLVRSKRMEIDSLQSVINKAKNALSIEDIDSQIHNMEHMIQHETLPLKEEKQLIREIKQLKQLREQLSSNMGNQDEIKQALEQREEVEERLKILRKELDILKDRVLKAEAVAMEAEKKYDHENKKVKELQAQFRAADDVRQAAYAQWQNLRKELLKKSKHFFKYKDDAAVASNYAFSRDTEALYHLCTKHVDNFMELWNTNNEFRREYVKFNARSTIRRFGTLDGRSLGPDEEPHVLPTYFDDRANRLVSTPVKPHLASQVPPRDLKQETTVQIVTSDGKLTKQVTEHKSQKVTKNETAETVQVKGLDTDSGRDINDEVDVEPKKSKEEIEAIRKAEEMRREEAEAKLKEQRRLEELAKANEARERKKRLAEKQQIRAELKAQKEAEEKEKEKEKRLRKKERKKAAAIDANDTKNSSEPPPSSESAEESSKDIEVKDMSSVKAKKAQKPWSTKQNKTKSVPPPLRNRNKKKWQQWMWVAITSLIIFVLFWLGNIGVFSNVNFRRRSPTH